VGAAFRKRKTKNKGILQAFLGKVLEGTRREKASKCIAEKKTEKCTFKRGPPPSEKGTSPSRYQASATGGKRGGTRRACNRRLAKKVCAVTKKRLSNELKKGELERKNDKAKEKAPESSREPAFAGITESLQGLPGKKTKNKKRTRPKGRQNELQNAGKLGEGKMKKPGINNLNQQPREKERNPCKRRREKFTRASAKR